MSRIPGVSRLDTIYRNVLLSKFFVKGWGDPENMKRLFNFRKIISDRDKCNELVKSDHPVYIDRKVEENEHYELFEGHFLSPLVDYLPNMIPHESHTARFQLIIPRLWRNLDNSAMRPLCLQLAGTGDHVSLLLLLYCFVYCTHYSIQSQCPFSFFRFIFFVYLVMPGGGNKNRLILL